MSAADLEWATDSEFTNGPDAGTPTKVEPVTATKKEGYVPEEILPAQHLNWQLNKIYENATNVETSLGYIVDILAANAPLIDVLVRRIVITDFTVVPAYGSGSIEWERVSPMEYFSRVNGAFLRKDFRGLLPHGATIVAAGVMWKPGRARSGTARGSIAIVEKLFETSPPVAHTSTIEHVAYANANTDLQLTTIESISYAVDSTKGQSFLITAGMEDSPSHLPDMVHAIIVDFIDPGPRNF